ncbi:MAG: deoxyribose-phosphate aldolase [bacterium]
MTTTQHESRNPIMDFDADLLTNIQVNSSAVERRAGSYANRRSIKKNWQVAWLIQAIRCIDLTTLAGDDTPGRVRRLCNKAMRPVRQDILDQLNIGEMKIHTGAVCVYHEMLGTANEMLKGHDIGIAAVSTGFPAGLNPLPLRIAEIEASVAAGATEIDIVISRRHVLTGDWQALYDEVKSYRIACGEAHMKTILATGELGTLRNVAKASMVCMMAGADFIKTSTGKEPVNATLPVSLVMVRCVRDYFERTGYKVGFKPAGGISTAKDAISWLILMKEELGFDWMQPELFRFGASSLLGDIERQLEHAATGIYSASYRNPLG